MQRYVLAVTLTALSLSMLGCEAEARSKSPPAPRPAVAPTNRISLPAEVIENLGITFAKVERRRLETRMLIPGRLDVPRSQRWELRAPAAGRIAFRKQRLDDVAAGEVIAELATPQLRTIQLALASSLDAEAEATIEERLLRARTPEVRKLYEVIAAELTDSAARIAAATRLRDEAIELESVARARADRLTKVSEENTLVRKELFDARAALADAAQHALEASTGLVDVLTRVAELRVKAAELRAEGESSAQRLTIAGRRRAAAELAFHQHLKNLSGLTGVQVETLEGSSAEGVPGWRALTTVTVRAPASGVLVDIAATTGEWLGAAASIGTIIDTSLLSFRGQLPEADLAGLPPEAPARVDPVGDGFAPIDTKLVALLPVANPVARTVLVEAFVPNASRRLPAGISATVSVLLARSGSDEAVVPVDCVVQDDLEWILFKRDDASPSQVVRTPVSLGRRADGWVEVLSGVIEDDEVVRDGIHQLKQTGIGKAATGHFHADGSWHDDDKDED